MSLLISAAEVTAALVAAASAWVACCAIAGRRASSDRADEPGPILRLAILIPAHDEERDIGACIRSLYRSRYPRDRFDVYVLADNCRDATAARAREAGAQVWERNEPDRRGKGYALNALIERVRELPGYDGWVFFDADARVDPRCLAALGRRLAAGDRAVQGYYGMRSGPGSWGRIAVLAGRLFNGARPAGRAALGFSAGLRGNGMAFRPSVFDGRRWRDEALLEDWELALDLAEEGIAVGFCREARVRTRPAPTRRAARQQRRRWEGARPALIARRLPGLLAAALRRRDPLPLESAIDLLVPPLTVLLVGGLAASLAGAWLGSIALLPLGGASLIALAVAVWSGDRFDRPPVLLRSLRAVPAFLLWKLGLYGSLRTAPRDGSWVRTERGRVPEPVERAEVSPAGRVEP